MRTTMALAALVTVCGCTSLQGRPSPVMDMGKVVDTVQASYDFKTAMTTYAGKNSVADKRAYRDEVVFAHMAAVNARYRNFMIGLSSQYKTLNAVVDTAALGLSSGATLAGKETAQALAAGSTFLSGSQGKVNSRLYYEQTLPALINIMESERADVRTQILAKMNNDTSVNSISYGMAEALMDIAEYEDAVSMERAVSRLSQDAAARLTESSDNLKAAEAARAAP